jgi:hypothetical protein
MLPGSPGQISVKGMNFASQYLLAEARQPAPQVFAQEGLLLAQTSQGSLLIALLPCLRLPLGQMSHEFQF